MGDVMAVDRTRVTAANTGMSDECFTPDFGPPGMQNRSYGR